MKLSLLLSVCHQTADSLAVRSLYLIADSFLGCKDELDYLYLDSSSHFRSFLWTILFMHSCHFSYVAAKAELLQKLPSSENIEKASKIKHATTKSVRIK